MQIRNLAITNRLRVIITTALSVHFRVRSEDNTKGLKADRVG